MGTDFVHESRGVYTILFIDNVLRGQVWVSYRQTSSIGRTISANLNIRLVLQLYLPNPLKPGFKHRVKM